QITNFGYLQSLHVSMHFILKYFSLLITILFFTMSSINAQEVRVIDNKGTIKTVRNNQVTTGTAAPTDPLERDVWFDTSFSPTQTKVYDEVDGWINVETKPSVFTGFFIIERPVGSSDTFTKNITELPFQPSKVTFVAHANVDSIDSKGNNSNDNDPTIKNSFGTMNGFTNALTDAQQVIYVGGSGNSINRIGWFSSSSHCIGVRYGNRDAENLGIITGALSFTATGIAIEDGFDINVEYNASNRQATAFRKEKLVVLYTAYK
ncbi:MAG: hypothetical protein ACI921_000887, partial [Polaribacter sp.]